MGMLLRCPCGANLVAPPHVLSIVCASCQRTIAIPLPDVPPSSTQLGLSETVPAFAARRTSRSR